VCWILSASSKVRVFVVANMKRLISLLLMVGMLDLCGAELKFKILLNEIMENWIEAAVAKLVRKMNILVPSSFSGRLPD